MLSDAERRRAAAMLLEAERSRQQTGLLSDAFPGIGIEDAYAIQRELLDAKLAAGARVRGHKIGLTSKVMQAASGIDEPDYGHLLDDMFYAEGDRIPAERFLVPRVEVELAFVLGARLEGPGVTITDVLDATRYVMPALEIIDTRTRIPRKIFDTVADNAACGAVVLGGRPVRPLDVDLRWIGAALYRNAVIEESGVSAAVLGHPALGVAWLANKVGRFGTVLDAGQVVLAGSFTRPVAVAKGDVVHADYGPLGSIAVSFN
jgi:2-oxo-hept-3-ene-1,7-dioate hydratase